MTEAEKRQRTTVYLPESLHRQARRYAFDRAVTLTYVMERALRDFLAKEEEAESASSWYSVTGEQVSNREGQQS